MLIYLYYKLLYFQNKNEIYEDSKLEKIIRGSVKSEVIRLVTQENVVIVDAPNYIKGYR